MNYTPGPWKAKRQSESTWGVWSKSKKGAVAYCGKEDAHLIAAAPEMVELLDDVAMELSIISPILHPANGHVEALLERIDALLRRIEGEEV